MLKSPEYWKKYYLGDAEQVRLARVYSFSDRMRYYWPMEAVQAAQEKLFANLNSAPIPLPLLSQYMPRQFTAVREGTLSFEATALVKQQIKNTLIGYVNACHLFNGNTSK